MIGLTTSIYAYKQNNTFFKGSQSEGKIMQIKAILTYGWKYQKEIMPAIDENIIPAIEIDRQARQHLDHTKSYDSTIKDILTRENNAYKIDRVDELFRKEANGFNKIKEFISSLLSIDIDGIDEILIYVDVFTYNFVKCAKNFDLFIPETKETKYINCCKNAFRNKQLEWKNEIETLETFELEGKGSLTKDLKDIYLNFRKIILRRSARDEIRTLYSLLLSGPSTLNEISNDLGLDNTLSQRIVAAFENTKLIDKQIQTEKYYIQTKVIPMILFGLREILGIDCLKGID